jgi:ABC-2 type transport system permease protein
MPTATATTVFESPAAFRSAGRAVARNRQHDLAAVPAAIGSEWIKLRSLRSNSAIFGLTIVVGLVMSWVLATLVKTWLTTVLAVIMGVLLFTSEVQHGTIANTVAAQPARWVAVAAKSAVAAGFGLAMGIVGMAAGLAGAVVSGLGAGDTSGMAATAGWGLLLTTFAAVLGLGIGLVVRHSAAAVSAVLVWAFVIENLIRSVAPASLSRFLPFSAANGLLTIRTAGDTPETLAAALSRPQDALLFVGFTIAAIVAGTVLLYRRDAD